MKIGILTIYGGSNYGNKLQNYALQKYLDNLGIYSETLRYTIDFKKKNGGKKFLLLKKKYFSNGVSESIWNLKCIADVRIHKRDLDLKSARRLEAFKEFEENNIRISDKEFSNIEELRNYCLRFDYIIVGSDQVWNPFWHGSHDEFFLNFIPLTKRIAYAPSFGIDYIPEDKKERYARLLNGFDRLSCREQQGCELIYKLTTKFCEHVCDPVFLLSTDEWKKKVKSIKKNYIVTYFLGGKSLKVNKMVAKYAQKNNYQIVDLWSEKDFKSEYVSIENFLSYIANAKMVFTDSFQGCAFSLIFKTPFVICNRNVFLDGQNMSSRLLSLIEKLQIKNCLFNTEDIPQKTVDFDKVDEYLIPWIENSKIYLNSCLGLSEDN